MVKRDHTMIGRLVAFGLIAAAASCGGGSAGPRDAASTGVDGGNGADSALGADGSLGPADGSGGPGDGSGGPADVASGPADGSGVPPAESGGPDGTTEASSPREAGAADSAAADSSGTLEASADGPAAPEGGSIANLQPDTWQWVPFPNALCRDGTATGIGINPHAGSTRLMLFLEGGGACFNSQTCAVNPSHFDGSSFQSLLQQNGTPGIFNRADTANPVGDWNMVYIPYCTGDVHAGNQPNGSAPGVAGTQAFVGYANITAYLARIVPTFPHLDQVLLTGVSAGGFGSMANYVHVVRAFGGVPVSLLDDSGPFMDAPYVALCLSQSWVSTWALDQTVLADCGPSCANDGHFLIDYVKHAVGAYPTTTFGLVDSTDDAVITQFFGFGTNSCTASTPLTGATFTAGLDDIRAQLASYPNFGAYVFSGTRHTTLEDTANFDSQTVAGPDGGSVTLSGWIARLVAGQVSNAGP
jgi:hypothetical protein